MTSHPSVLTQSLNVNAPVFVRWEVASPTAFTCNKKKEKLKTTKHSIYVTNSGRKSKRTSSGKDKSTSAME